MRRVSDIALDLADLLFFEDSVVSFLLRIFASALVLVVPPYLSVVAIEAAHTPVGLLPAMAVCFVVIPFGMPGFIAKGRALNAWSLGVALALVGAVLLEQAMPMEIDTAPIPDFDSMRFAVNCTILLAIVGTACRWLWIGVHDVAGRFL
jgi:hypothetical protein